jgi:PAS domain S-box-containing protein
LSELRATESEMGYAGTDASLKAVLDCVALPVWVVDHEGLVVLANPAALAALGFNELSELQGRHGHNTIHYKHLDGSPYPAEDCTVLEPSRSGEPVHSDEDWFIRRDGTPFPVSFTSVPIDLPTGRGVVMTFIDMTAQRQPSRRCASVTPSSRASPSRSGSSTTSAVSVTRIRRRWPRSATSSPSSWDSRVTTRSTTSTPTGRRSRPRTVR